MKISYYRIWNLKLLLVFICFFVSGCSKTINQNYHNDEDKARDIITEADIKAEAGIKTEADINADIGKKAETDMNANTEKNTDSSKEVLQSQINPQFQSEKNQISQNKDSNLFLEPVNLTISHDFSYLDEMKDRNCRFIKYQDRVYYRQYHEDSFEGKGVFKRYQPIKGSRKEMICIYPDGRKEAVFTDTGNGQFFIVNDRIYMTEMDTASSAVYSVDMQGENRTDYGNGFIRGVDEQKSFIFMELCNPPEDGAFLSQFYVLNCKNNELKLLWEDKEGIKDYIIYDDGRIYYRSCVVRNLEDTNDREYTLRLLSMRPDGTDERLLAVMPIVKSYRQSIQQVQIVDGIVYFSYGGYQGSASVYQGGSIASVKTDGTDFKVIVNSEESFASEYFYVQNLKDRTLIHYNSMIEMQGENMVARDTITGEEFPSNLPYQSKGQPHKIFWCNWNDGIWESGSIYTIADYFGTVIELADSLDEKIQWSEGVMPDLRDMSYIDGYLYFTSESSEFDESASIGWRDGYKRLRTEVYRLKVDEGILEQLYYY